MHYISPKATEFSSVEHHLTQVCRILLHAACVQ